ncbi:hypothetical protein IV203_019201 [Nitzschia inconspicua]|uniref:Uncharacterized protein n=1 Tax=Nitzschia inconspicua TaxID=303405 RepID=A0A9K3Q4P8_9STRA|nr:hypothetical protein IV203_019201 [Nitzschia inconspicua]
MCFHTSSKYVSKKQVRILDSLPTVARSAIGPMLDAVFECELGAAKKPKEQRYFRSMRLHFIWFPQQHHLYYSLFPVVKLSLETMNYVMACYACHLATGHSLSSLTMRTGTICKYLIAAASLIAIFDSEPGRDARKEKGSDSLCSPLEKVLKEQKRWEDVPDRQKGWTVGLQLALMKKYSHLPFRGKHQAITDWFVVALHGGFRRAEWAQDRGHTELNQPERNVRNVPAAFCLDDVKFKGDNGRPLLHSSVLQSPNQLFLSLSAGACKGMVTTAKRNSSPAMTKTTASVVSPLDPYHPAFCRHARIHQQMKLSSKPLCSR